MPSLCFLWGPNHNLFFKKLFSSQDGRTITKSVYPYSVGKGRNQEHKKVIILTTFIRKVRTTIGMSYCRIALPEWFMALLIFDPLGIGSATESRENSSFLTVPQQREPLATILIIITPFFGTYWGSLFANVLNILSNLCIKACERDIVRILITGEKTDLFSKTELFCWKRNLSIWQWTEVLTLETMLITLNPGILQASTRVQNPPTVTVKTFSYI